MFEDIELRKSKVRGKLRDFFQILVAFLENMNFTSKQISVEFTVMKKKPGLKLFLCFWIQIRKNILYFRMNSGQLKIEIDSVVLAK